MRKLFMVLMFALSISFFVSAEDTIGECIKNYNVKKLQEIASHDLVIRTENKQKYLMQLEAMKREIAVFKDHIKNGRSAVLPDGIFRFQLGAMGIQFMYLMSCSISMIAAAIVYAVIPANDPARIPLTMTVGLSGILSFYCGFKSILKTKELSDRFYRKVITMEALIKSIPAVGEVSS